MDVTVVLFADELQRLFGDPEDLPPQKLLDEISIVAQARGVASFFFGSAYHLVDGLVSAGLDMSAKMPTVRLLPVTKKTELVATKPYWHPTWFNTTGLTAAPGAQLDDALLRRLFLETGGVLRYMIDLPSSDQPPIPEPTSMPLAVLAHLYSENRTLIENRAENVLPDQSTAMQKMAARRGASEFDPFDQAHVRVRDLCSNLSGDEETVAAAEIHKLADAGWCLLYMRGNDECASFLYPKHYALMESTSNTQPIGLCCHSVSRWPHSRRALGGVLCRTSTGGAPLGLDPSDSTRVWLFSVAGEAR